MSYSQALATWERSRGQIRFRAVILFNKLKMKPDEISMWAFFFSEMQNNEITFFFFFLRKKRTVPGFTVKYYIAKSFVQMILRVNHREHNFPFFISASRCLLLFFLVISCFHQQYGASKQKPLICSAAIFLLIFSII